MLGAYAKRLSCEAMPRSRPRAAPQASGRLLPPDYADPAAPMPHENELILPDSPYPFAYPIVNLQMQRISADKVQTARLDSPGALVS